MNEEVNKREAPIKPRKRNAWGTNETIDDVDRRVAQDRPAAVAEINRNNIDLAAYRNAHEHLTASLERMKSEWDETKVALHTMRENKVREAREDGEKVERLHDALSFLGMTDNAILAVTDGNKTAEELFPKGKGILKSRNRS